MEASALHRQSGLPGVPGRSPLLRLRSDEQLIAATRRGNQAAFETLVQRYQPRLLAFCRHMLGSKEDAEDVLQEVFAAAYNALLGDDRPINTRPWLYRIARNRSLNHLRKPRAAGQDSMDIFEREHGVTAADTVHRREEFRQIVADVGHLPESQRTALLLREIDAMSYDQIAESMDTTVPSVKSLLVRARVSLAEAAEARMLTCAEVRLELGQVAEGLAKTSAPVRRHLKTCDRCRAFRGELRNTSKALAAIYPVGPLLILHKLGLAKIGLGGGAAAGGAAAGVGAGGGTVAGGAGIAAGGAAAAASGGAAAAGGAISAGIGTLGGKAAAGMAAAALVTAGAVEVKHVTKSDPAPAPSAVVSTPHSPPTNVPAKATKAKPKRRSAAKAAPAAAVPAVEAAPAEAEAAPQTAPAAPPAPAAEAPAAPAPPVPADTIQEEEGTVTLPARPEQGAGGSEAGPPPTTTSPEPAPPPTTTTPAPPPDESAATPPPPPPASSP